MSKWFLRFLRFLMIAALVVSGIASADVRIVVSPSYSAKSFVGPDGKQTTVSHPHFCIESFLDAGRFADTGAAFQNALRKLLQNGSTASFKVKADANEMRVRLDKEKCPTKGPFTAPIGEVMVLSKGGDLRLPDCGYKRDSGKSPWKGPQKRPAGDHPMNDLRETVEFTTAEQCFARLKKK